LKNKLSIRKILIATAWLAVIAGMTTLLVAASRRQTEHVCHKVVVRVKAAGAQFLVEQADIQRQLEKLAGGSLVNRRVESIPLATLEKGLMSNQWIRKAELYIDREDVLYVSVEEREPVARVFTAAGRTFYMDSSGHQMPLLDKVSARLPVVTNYPLGTRLNGEDSLLLQQVKELVAFIQADPFWNAQVGQIDITADRRFELIPVIGDHVIRLGKGEDLEDKFSRLRLFYSNVLGKAGFNKYHAVDVQYAGQVVGVRGTPVSAIDSLQLQKNIAELMSRSTLQPTADMLPDGSGGQPAAVVASLPPADTAKRLSPVPVKTNPNPAARTGVPAAKPTRSTTPRGGAIQEKPKPKEAKPTPAKKETKPRAVMQRRA
jgi:cell division protein FtsQ